MKKYKCHKVVEAAKIVGIPPMPEVANNLNVVYLDLDGTHHYEMELSDVFMKKHGPEVGGYIVQYEDGYMSYSPAKAFEEGYELIDPVSDEPENVTCQADHIGESTSMV